MVAVRPLRQRRPARSCRPESCQGSQTVEIQASLKRIEKRLEELDPRRASVKS
jgi:hypothetical protein